MSEMDADIFAHLASLVDMDISSNKRVPRDSGYGGGGGCGGIEVFAFLAFLLALLSLILQLNDNGGGGGGRSVRAVGEEIKSCQVHLDLSEGLWAVTKLTEGVLKAIEGPPTCSHAHLCEAASAAASRGPLGASLTSLASDWLERWPSLQGSTFGQVTRQAGVEKICRQYAKQNCSDLAIDFRIRDLISNPDTLSYWKDMKNNWLQWSSFIGDKL